MSFISITAGQSTFKNTGKADSFINSPDSGMHLGDSLDPDAILVYGLLLSA